MTRYDLRFGFYCSFYIAVLGGIFGCAPPVKVAVEERTVLTVRQQSEKIGGSLVRIVQSGDTLHGIAFGANIDVNRLAAWNNISDTSQLRIGQRVRLTQPIGFVHKPKVAVTKPEPKTNSKPNKVLAEGDGAKTSSRSTKKSDSSVGQQPARAISKAPPAVNPLVNNLNIKWTWPFSGKVIRKFSPSSTQQGVDILGKNGQAVMASASGEVVYAGNSLKGYGNLIIIKHSEDYLSAYAHNKKILVAEGQKIKSKQVIGAVGLNNRQENALHFQIRKQGKPVNPLTYLKS